MQAKLSDGVTTFCTCWRIDPKTGPSLGFTDHDCDLSFDGLTFEASSGFEASGVERSLGFSIDNAAATGALSSDRLTEKDIQRGRFDGAVVTQWIVDWSAPQDRLLTFKGEIGDIRRGNSAFEAELRGLAERLNRPIGRSYLHNCDCDLGDVRCKVDTSDAQYSVVGTVVSSPNARALKASGLGAFQSDWFTNGRLTWLSGAMAGDEYVAKRSVAGAANTVIDVDRDMSDAPQPGDTFRIIAGCDKRKSTCAAKFDNLVNFRGFPFMPGETWVTAYPVRGDVHDGGSQSGA